MIRFILNDEPVALSDISPTMTLLDWLREKKRLTGSKEGCGEGDCGACTVLVGRLLNGELVYETVNACIRFVASLSATHVVTIEHLAGKDGELHPVQQAMVDCHGSQCGFCTPGFVMSLYSLWMSNPAPSANDVEVALQGNLCRCTGYETILKAALKVAAERPDALVDPVMRNRAEISAKLEELKPKKTIRQFAGTERFIVPANLSEFAQVLATEPNATIVAGSTDTGLWVTKQMRDISPVVFIGHLDELQTIQQTSEGITFGAGVTYSQALPVFKQHFPKIAKLFYRIGGQQVRNMGTIGGNIANGSPIGDTPPPLIALGATLRLHSMAGPREIALEDFFIAYGKQDRLPGEFVESLTIPFLPRNDHFAVYKISKRRDEDISALCGAFRIALDDENSVTEARIAFGGMAATPKRATEVENFLKGKPWSAETANAARDLLSSAYSPLSDWRATAEYRALTAGNLMLRFFAETTGEAIELQRYAMQEAGE
ncbi:xanthine dehydrogenase small subunit [Rhizobium sp. L1K21]|uniref:xanthine dehydrogenase small subunit n=1 Tax=Rhizobium sp. L1K21 TaxID=2954933 RepID=UPI00209263BA|nr:xanthine dehydrogenase small subunit [Rhizobium sp. L1K21]MCO6185131.1 xanthine dehydrogenase small subunit [Rhizobium sp. L1K21]